LTDLELPGTLDVDESVDVQLDEALADVILTTPERTLRFSMKVNEQDEEIYEIVDVTLYDNANEQTLSLAAALTARPVAEMFVESLRQRDRKMLQYSSTIDLRKQTWSRGSSATLSVVPMDMIDLSDVEITETQFHGDVTHIHMGSANEKVTVVLHQENGRILVDDLIVKSITDNRARSRSLKNYLAAVIPAYELASQVHHDQPRGAFRLVTDDYFERVFSLVESMPETCRDYLQLVSSGKPKVFAPRDHNQADPTADSAAQLLNLPETNEVAKQIDNHWVVAFATEAGQMLVLLREEDELLRVDDALVASSDNAIVEYLKQKARMEVATNRSNRAIRTVGAEIPQKLNPVSTSALPAQPTNPSKQSRDVVSAVYEEKSSHRPPRSIEQMSHSVREMPQSNKRQQPDTCANHESCSQILLQPVPTR